MTADRDHYSYTVYADPATARSFDDRRFGGPIGDLVARDQAEVLREFVGNIKGRSVLDVGTGTGRAALLLAEAGGQVTGVDASEEMLAVARQRAAERGAEIEFLAGDAHTLAFADQSFDVSVSLRVLMHTPGWRTSLNELCRVTRDIVIVDYPSVHSLAVVQSLGRKVVHAASGRTEPYRVFFDGQIAAAFQANGFRVRSTRRLFVLPIGLHKAVGSAAFTAATEGALRRLGFLRLFGSPVTILAERCATS